MLFVEVKLLFHHLLGIPILDIADDHQEVLAFSGLKSAEMADSLYCSVMLLRVALTNAQKLELVHFEAFSSWWA